MCRADVEPAAEPLLAQLLKEIADAIAKPHGGTWRDVRIGPVDLGPPDSQEVTP